MPAVAGAKPLEGVDCEQIAATDVALFAFLTENTPIRFASLGDMISALHTDDALFTQMNGAFVGISAAFGDPISFESATEAITTHTSCRLNPLMISLVASMNS
jgi:hypothetical protein